MHNSFLKRWVGPVLALIGIVAVLWLGIMGKLELYIHPRYVVFTMIMALVGLVLTLAAFFTAPGWRQSHSHAPAEVTPKTPKTPATAGATATTSTPADDATRAQPQSRRARADRRPRRHTLRSVLRGTGAQLGAAAIIVAAMFALLVLPPAPLSLSAAEQRSVNSSVSGSSDATVSDEQLASIDTSTFTVKEWTTYLNMGVSAEFLAENPVDVTGFVTADAQDPDNVFYVARFSITCCAVDASPLGLAVYKPNWKTEHPEGSWVRVRGGLVSNPSAFSTETYAVVPTEVEATDDSEDPYVY